MKIPTPSSFNISDQLAAIDWAYSQWLESDKNEELDSYLGNLLVSFARAYPPAVLTAAEYSHFTSIGRDLCVAGGMSDDELNS
jgi:hypothetical protein